MGQISYRQAKKPCKSRLFLLCLDASAGTRSRRQRALRHRPAPPQAAWATRKSWPARADSLVRRQREPVDQSKEWSTSSRLFGLLAWFLPFSQELVVHSTEWTTGSRLFGAFDLVSAAFRGARAFASFWPIFCPDLVSAPHPTPHKKPAPWCGLFSVFFSLLLCHVDRT